MLFSQVLFGFSAWHLLIEESGPCTEVSSSVISDGCVLCVSLEEVESREALDVTFGVRDVILSGVELCDHDVGSVQSSFEFLVFRLGGLAVSAPRRLEEDHDVLALDFLLEGVGGEHDDVVFLALCRCRLRLDEALQGASCVCSQESLDACGSQLLVVRVHFLLDVVLDEHSAFDSFASHLLLEETLELAVVEPHVALLALEVLHAGGDGGHRFGVGFVEAEPEHIKAALLLELLVLGGQLAHQRVCTLGHECVDVAACSYGARDCAIFDEEQSALGLSFDSCGPEEGQVGLLLGSNFLHVRAGLGVADQHEGRLAGGGLSQSGDLADQRSVFLVHEFNDGVCSASAVLVGKAGTLLGVPDFEGRESLDALLGGDVLVLFLVGVHSDDRDACALQLGGCHLVLGCKVFAVSAPWCLEFNQKQGVFSLELVECSLTVDLHDVIC
mmetsp:Transcript_32048/g.69835  ORF Transcript_32048/g.69835 Transcript_32048/m.69835 type:complete len:443 (+) Transcript_32048:64-1392(+)